HERGGTSERHKKFAAAQHALHPSLSGSAFKATTIRDGNNDERKSVIGWFRHHDTTTLRS
ncbi:MAG: hypothetical protein WBX95_11465, partial [Xanthobacteraceae bacterium]